MPNAMNSDTARDLNRLKEADRYIRIVLKTNRGSAVASRLEIASHNLAEAAAMIERGT